MINIDQTPLKCVPVSKETMAKRNSTSLTTEGSDGKRMMITGTFTVTLSGNFLSIQLIYGGKTNQSIPRYNFPEDFCLSANPKHFSNTEESLKYLDEVIILCFVKEIRLLNDQKSANDNGCFHKPNDTSSDAGLR